MSKISSSLQLRKLFTDEEYLNDVWHSESFMQTPMNDEAVSDESNSNTKPNWRLRDKMKTSGAVLCVCLNVGTDPPDVVKPSPAARKECWFDPFSVTKIKALEIIGNNLHQQYEKMQSKVKYKQCLDPTSDDLRRICVSLRKNSKNDRLLFHYNGHGVPRPTENGEIWVFGKHYTHYMPVSVCELRHWICDPGIYVFDCSGAGILMKQLINQHVHMQGESVCDQTQGNDVNSGAFSTSLIILSSCAADEILPMSPLYPADIFTSCLTTPIQISVHWFILKNQYSMKDVPVDIAEKIPGKDNERKSPKGELVWIFTAITDTIAWDVLPSYAFQKLFRQDLLVASLFRNFLLAQRILKSMGCTALCYPSLPDCSNHPLWQSWDLAVEGAIKHLHQLQTGAVMVDSKNSLGSSFFTTHLTAFDVWIDLGYESSMSSVDDEKPSQLPVILQVLLSQSHRMRALGLIQKYLILSPNAINLTLVVGIFPYIVKLLQSPAPELKPVMISIWCNIMAFDVSCRNEIVRDPKLTSYFITYLSSKDVHISPLQRCLAACVITELCNANPEGRKVCLQRNLHKSCISVLKHQALTCAPNANNTSLSESANMAIVRQWVALCIAKMCENYPEAKYACIKEGAHEVLFPLVQDAHPLVRAAAVYALGELFGAPPATSHVSNMPAAPVMFQPPPGPMNPGSMTPGSLNPGSMNPGSMTPMNPGAGVMSPMGPGGGYSFQGLNSPPRNPVHTPKAVHGGMPGLQRTTSNGSLPLPPHLASSNSQMYMMPGPDGPGGQGCPEIPFDLKQFELNLVMKMLERMRDAAVIVRKEVVIAISKFVRLSPHIQCIEILVQALAAMRKNNTNRGDRSGSDIATNKEPPLPSSSNRSRDSSLEGDGKHGIGTGSSHGASNPGTAGGNRVRSNSIPVSGEETNKLMEKLRVYISDNPLFNGLIQSMTAASSSEQRHMLHGISRESSNASLVQLGATPPNASGTGSGHTSNSREGKRKQSFVDPTWSIAGAYVKLWLALRDIQVKEPHSMVCQALSSMHQVILVKSQSDRIVRQSMSASKGGSDAVSNGSGAGAAFGVSPFTPSNGAGSTGANGDGMPPTPNRKSFNPSSSSGHNQQKLSSALMSVPEDVATDEDKPNLNINPPNTSESVDAEDSSDFLPDQKVADKYIALFESLPAFRSHLYDWSRRLFMEMQRQSHVEQQHAALMYNISTGKANNGTMTVGLSNSLGTGISPVGLGPLGLENNNPTDDLYSLLKTPYVDPLSREGSDAYYKLAKRADMVATFQDIACQFKMSTSDPMDPALNKDVSSPESSRFTDYLKIGSNGATRDYADKNDAPQSIKFEQKAILNTENSEMTSMVLFHAYQDVLAISDGTGVDIWSLENGSKVMKIKNTPNLGASAASATARITSMQWLNEATDALLLIGSDDGTVKVWHDSGSEETTTVTSSGGATLATAFVALPDVIEIQKGSGLVSSWDQTAGRLTVGGNSPTIRLWDLNREQCVRSFKTGFDTCTTAIASYTCSPNLHSGETYSSNTNVNPLLPSPQDITTNASPYTWSFAGFADGSVAMFDDRVGSHGGRVNYSKEHKAWVVSAQLRADVPEVITGTLSGTIKFWDVRSLRPFKTIEVHKSPLTAMAVHNYAPIIATGSHAQFIKFITMNGEQLGMIRYHDGFLGQRIGPVSCLAFHPSRMLLAAGATDNIVSIYATADS